MYLEVEVPQQAAAEWQASLNLLHSAEDAFDRGDDDSTFQRLRGAFDALPGAKKQIYAAIADPSKRTAIDKLTLEFGKYLHLGRQRRGRRHGKRRDLSCRPHRRRIRAGCHQTLAVLRLTNDATLLTDRSQLSGAPQSKLRRHIGFA